MRSAIAIGLLLAVGVFVGCNNEQAGPSTSQYEKARNQAQKGKKGPKVAARKLGGGGGTEQAAAGSKKKAGVTVALADDEALAAAMAYAYDATAKRDPFRSFILDQAKDRAEKDAGPLEQFDVSQLTIVAVVWDTHVPRALVADPSGRPYIVSEGTLIGKNEGRIIEIEDDLVVVKETYYDWQDRPTTKDIEMRLTRHGKGGELR